MRNKFIECFGPDNVRVWLNGNLSYTGTSDGTTYVIEYRTTPNEIIQFSIDNLTIKLDEVEDFNKFVKQSLKYYKSIKG